MIGPVPAVVLAAGILLVYLFPITKVGHEKMLAELARRRAQNKKPHYATQYWANTWSAIRRIETQTPTHISRNLWHLLA